MTGSLEEGDKLESEKNVNPNRKITAITVRNVKLLENKLLVRVPALN